MKTSTESLIATRRTNNEPCINHHISMLHAFRNRDIQGFQQTMLRKGVRMEVLKMFGSVKRSISLQTNLKEWR